MVVLVATLPDGRTATRGVEAPDRLLPTVQALVLLPPPEAFGPPNTTGSASAGPSAGGSETPRDPTTDATSDADARAATPGASSASVAVAPVTDPDAPASAVASSAPPAIGSPIRFELGAALGSGTYLKPNYVGFDVSFFAGIRIASVGLALLVRWDPTVRPIPRDPSGFEMSSVAVGFGVNHRWNLAEAVAVDLGATASVVAQTQSYERSGDETVGSETDARFGVMSRVLLGRHDWRWLASVDAFVSPQRLLHPIRLEPQLPALPAWFVGFSVGVAFCPR